MTRVEIAAIVHRLAAAYRADITEAEAEVWAHHLAHLDQSIAFAATDRLISSTDGYMPTIAKFKETYRAEARSAEAHRPALPAPPSQRSDPDALKALLAETRRTLSSARGGRRVVA